MKRNYEKDRSLLFFPELLFGIEEIRAGTPDIPLGRREKLLQLSNAIVERMHTGKGADLVFICTHNSRRSQMGQAWAHAASRYFDLEGIRTWSGGTEATAFHPHALTALESMGFRLEPAAGEMSNPGYVLKLSEGDTGTLMYSKKFDDPMNPAGGFIAIIVCSDAEKACPIVPGASARISLNYQDPGEFDGTGNAIAKYIEKSREIGSELFFTMAISARMVIEITGDE